jgi:plasmid stabilization system protein ParE
MVKTLELAITKAASLPEAAQEQLGRELLERIETLAELRAEIEIGVGELDAGLGEELDVENVIKQARDQHARGASAVIDSTVEIVRVLHERRDFTAVFGDKRDRS